MEFARVGIEGLFASFFFIVEGRVDFFRFLLKVARIPELETLQMTCKFHIIRVWNQFWRAPHSKNSLTF